MIYCASETQLSENSVILESACSKFTLLLEHVESRCAMTAEGIEPIFRTSNRLIRETDCSFHRYLAKEIDWNEPLVCIMGARGAGKTTLIFQHIKET